MCKVVREDERFAHALDDEQPVSGIVLSVCEKDFSCDAGTDGSDQMKNVVLARSVRKKEKEEIRRILESQSGAASSWKG